MRRRLVFNIPPGQEAHYTDIKGEILGRVWAPLYHGYGYYMAKSAFPNNAAEVDERLKAISKSNAKHTFAIMLATLIFGVKPMLQNLTGGIAWAEGESIFASWDGHVTFGSSHVQAHGMGFLTVSLIRELIKNPFGWRSLLMIVFFLWEQIPHTVIAWIGGWVNDGYRPVSELGHDDFRTDHVAHIGGLVTGILNSALLKFPYL